MIKDASYDEICESVSDELSKITDTRDIDSSSVEDIQSFSEEDNNNVTLDDQNDPNALIDSNSSKEKFKDLQFGNNYSPVKQKKKPLFGIFRKVR